MPVSTFQNHDQVKEINDNVIKSEQDKRQYRALELNNGMKVLLISDPTTDKSAASLDVHIGAMSDPKHLPGLAHFLEHMLFLGTKKYPCENEYSKYLSLHGGGSNAYTAGDHTNYHFHIVPEHLKGALDRFAQFFLSPLFTESATDREVKAVNSEHEKNIQSDPWRSNQLEKSLSDPNHDFSKFHTGNIKTLDEIPKSQGICVREELLNFHKKWYSSNIMGLAVLGKENLDDLTELVLENFPAVENKNVQIPEWNTHPFRQEDLKIKSFVVPVKDTRNLTITFPTPDLNPYYKANPGYYLAHLIGHEGPGSLLSELKSLSGAKGFGFFILKSDLTEEGIDHVDDIISLMFQYINLLRKGGSKEWIFNECKDIAGMMFRFKDKEDPGMYTTMISSALHDYPLKEVLSGPCLLEDFQPELIDIVSVSGKKFESVADQSEKWYGTKYKVEEIKNELIDSWKIESFNEKFKLPGKNDFIPTEFDLVEREKVPFVILAPGLPILTNTSMSKVWFKQDNEYLLPKSVIKIHLKSPLAYSDPLSCGLACMFVRLFQDALTEYSYDAQLAGLSYNLANVKSGMMLYMKGYNHKLNILLEKLMDCLTSFEVDEKRFEIFKEKYVRGLHNFKAEQPYQQAFYYTDILLSQYGWTKDDILQVSDQITFDKLKDFIPELLSKLCIECLCHGNLTEKVWNRCGVACGIMLALHLFDRNHHRPSSLSSLQYFVWIRICSNLTLSALSSEMTTHAQSLDIITIVEQKLEEKINSTHLHPCQLIGERTVQLPFGNTFLFNQQSTNANILADLYAQILSEPCFNVLRTQEQLGYIVHSGTHYMNGVLGFNVLVQSEFSPSYVNERIESFLSSVEDIIENMSDEEFQQNKTSLSEKRLEKPKRLYQQSNKYWSEIVSNQYNFDRGVELLFANFLVEHNNGASQPTRHLGAKVGMQPYNIEVEELKSITKEDLLKFHQKLVSHKSDERKKLSVQVVSTCKSHTENQPPQEGLTPAPELPEEPDFYNFIRPLVLIPSIRKHGWLSDIRSLNDSEKYARMCIYHADPPLTDTNTDFLKLVQDGELSKMADSLLNIQNHEETKASPKKKSMTPEKQNQLRDLLSRRKVTPVKCTKPENLSESRFLATLILEAEEKEIEEQTEAVTPPQSSLKLANSESKISSNSVATKKHVTHNIGGLVNPKSTVAKISDFLITILLFQKIDKTDITEADDTKLKHQSTSFGFENLNCIAPLSSTSTPFTFKSKPEISKPQFNEIKPLAPASILPVYEDITPPGTPASTTPVSGSQPQSIVRNLFTGGSTSSAFSAPSKSIEGFSSTLFGFVLLLFNSYLHHMYNFF
ncbi:Insulin-degrading enzyme [Nymphon striatum]|nr:Insulin-degrading enzyme [Nymphon striatum]